jgi:type II secretory pathway pseudopilin PulG
MTISTRQQLKGFTLIEVLAFIIITSLMMTTMLIGGNNALLNAPTTHQQWLATQTARSCMEWFLDQRRLNGYASLTCPSNPTVTACTAPAGLTVSTAITCTSWNGDANYKKITVTVAGQANSTISVLLGLYT